MVFLNIKENLLKLKICVMENSSKIILALLGAAAAGIAVGMLMAPDKGSELRKKLGEKAGDLASQVGELVTYGKEKFEEVTNTVSKQADGLINDATKRGERVKESIG